MNDKLFSCIAIMAIFLMVYKFITLYYLHKAERERMCAEGRRLLVAEYKRIFRSIDLCIKSANIILLEKRLSTFSSYANHFVTKDVRDKMLARLRKVLADKEKELIEMERELYSYVSEHPKLSP